MIRRKLITKTYSPYANFSLQQKLGMASSPKPYEPTFRDIPAKENLAEPGLLQKGKNYAGNQINRFKGSAVGKHLINNKKLYGLGALGVGALGAAGVGYSAYKRNKKKKQGLRGAMSRLGMGN